MENYRSRQLIRKYLDGSATPEEKAILETWYNEVGKNSPELQQEPDYDAVGADILRRLRTGQQAGLRRLWPQFAAAAVLIIGSFIMYQIKPFKLAEPGTSNNRLVISPGQSGAVLTLANGKQINLGKSKSGHVIYQNQTGIAKTIDSTLIYADNLPQAVSYNVLATPNGRTYSVVLTDGSKVWLNAGSSLRYPTAFTGSERKVFLEGEAYFEVTHDKAKPFYVVTGTQTTEDLGTAFDVSAYKNEPHIETTLISGSIKVTQGNESRTLNPGEQALTDNKGMFTLQKANAGKIAAWRNGMFVFDGDNIEVIMRQIARWYDVEVIYQTQTVDKDFVATVSRYNSISEVLRKLQLTGTINFKIEGRRVIVMP